MKFLIDTNILIALEPGSTAAIEAGADEAAEVARLIQQSGNVVVVHPQVLADFARDADLERRARNEHVLKKYPLLDGAPDVLATDEVVLGFAERGSNDWVDNHLLVAVARDAVGFLITQDHAIHTRAARLSISERVLTTEDALAMLGAMFARTPTPPPAVRAVKAHTLDNNDPIFESFRADYQDFDAWLRKCKLGDRPTWVIGDSGCLAAVCIVKPDDGAQQEMSGNVLKVCSFKVSETHVGARYGELLLKTLFVYAQENNVDWMYLTVFEKHHWLVTLLEDFGFRATSQRTALGELVMTKPMRPPAAPTETGLQYMVRYGPGRWSWTNANVWVIPIQPRYDAILFPDRYPQSSLFSGKDAFGNAIRKAYLCKAQARGLKAGDIIAFYRSATSKSIGILGVVESWIASDDPDTLQRFVAKRTVYSMNEIQQMAHEREVLAIRFRQVLHEFDEIRYSELEDANVLNAAPQSIVKLRPEGVQWLMQRLAQ